MFVKFRDALALAAGCSALFVAAGAHAADARHPTVVELYQSQGCSSCPPAIANINAIADRPDILALTFAVTYWDQLGWKDVFATKQYTDRQWEFARGFGHDQVWTPQVVINGRTDVVGARRGELDAALAKADRGTGGPSVDVEAGTVKVSGAAAKPGDVWVVRYDPRTIQVAIKAGENGGRTIGHRNVVRQLVKVGHWTGGAASFAVPAASQPGLATAAFVQSGTGGPIVAAGRG